MTSTGEPAAGSPAGLHGTVVACHGKGVLLTGPAGAGKSSLALRLIDAGGRLVADDRVLVEAADGLAMARPAPSLAGWIEVRGAGLARLSYDRAAPLALVVHLAPGTAVERLPEAARTMLEKTRKSPGARIALFDIYEERLDAFSKSGLPADWDGAHPAEG